MKFIAELKRRRRGSVLFMGWILLVLGFFTAKVVIQLLWPDPSIDRIDLRQEWGMLLLFTLPWLCLLLFYRQYRRHLVQYQNGDRSIGDSLRALLDENRIAQAQQKWVARLNGAMLLLVPLLVYQLRSAGKAGDEILVPAFVLLPALLLGIYAAMLWHRRHRLQPRQHQLETLLAAYAESGHPSDPQLQS